MSKQEKPISDYSDEEYKSYLGSLDAEEIRSILLSIDKEKYPNRYLLALQEVKRGNSIPNPKLRFARMYSGLKQPKSMWAILILAVGYFLESLISGRRPIRRIQWVIEEWWLFLAILVFIVLVALFLNSTLKKANKEKEEYLKRYPEVKIDPQDPI